MSRTSLFRVLGCLTVCAAFIGAVGGTVGGTAVAASSFVNFETPTVHPLDLSPDRNTLAVVNLAAGRLLLFDVADGNPKQIGSVSVGIDPVSVRFRNNQEVWVVNHISDSISIVDVPTLRVRATLDTDDEPADVVFAGEPERAFVSCSQANTVLVFEPDKLGKKPKRVKIGAEDPRAMAVSPNGKTVYVAIFESGNRSTVLAGGFDVGEQDNRPTIPRNVVSDPDGPYGGQNPPPNRGAAFEPPIASNLPTPPPVALIVKKNPAGRWLDDNAGDWTEFVSGSMASRSKRVSGWDVLDRDVATINAKSLRVGYIEGLMNLVMAVAVNPATGRVSAVGTDAINEVRFEPILNGRFLRVNLAQADPDGSNRSIVDLNPHLSYESARVPQATRNQSIGDPRAIVWNSAGTRAWVAGMGSNNVVVVDAEGRRVGNTIEVGQGAAGLALDEELGKLYVLNRFAASISVVDTDSGTQISRKKFFDPTPRAIREGRPQLYDTHKTSGLGHTSCASCHADSRTDRLAWDLGAPDGEMKSNADQNKSLIPTDVFPPDWHPMKGPMTTQTLQDIVGKEPHHWRGDRDGLEEFAEAFHGLLGDDKKLSRPKMKKFEKFLATIHFPPNPFRNFDNSLPTSVSLRDHRRSGRFGNEGKALPRGNARRGLELFRTRLIDANAITCVTCHTLPTGQGTPMRRNGILFDPIPAGPNGETHQALIGQDASEQHGFKVPHLRNLYDKVGMETTQKNSRAGFGFFHHGSIDSLARFVSTEIFDVESDREVADLVAFMLAFSGSDFEERLLEPPGTESLDVHAAVGRQVTVSGPAQKRSLIGAMVSVAATSAVELTVKTVENGAERGWLYDPAGDAFASDRSGETPLSLSALLARAVPGVELTFTVVAPGTGESIAFARAGAEPFSYRLRPSRRCLSCVSGKARVPAR